MSDDRRISDLDSPAYPKFVILREHMDRMRRLKDAHIMDAAEVRQQALAVRDAAQAFAEALEPWAVEYEDRNDSEWSAYLREAEDKKETWDKEYLGHPAPASDPVSASDDSHLILSNRELREAVQPIGKCAVHMHDGQKSASVYGTDWKIRINVHKGRHLYHAEVNFRHGAGGHGVEAGPFGVIEDAVAWIAMQMQPKPDEAPSGLTDDERRSLEKYRQECGEQHLYYFAGDKRVPCRSVPGLIRSSALGLRRYSTEHREKVRNAVLADRCLEPTTDEAREVALTLVFGAQGSGWRTRNRGGYIMGKARGGIGLVEIKPTTDAWIGIGRLGVPGFDTFLDAVRWAAKEIKAEGTCAASRGLTHMQRYLLENHVLAGDEDRISLVDADNHVALPTAQLVRDSRLIAQMVREAVESDRCMEPKSDEARDAILKAVFGHPWSKSSKVVGYTHESMSSKVVGYTHESMRISYDSCHDEWDVCCDGHVTSQPTFLDAVRAMSKRVHDNRQDRLSDAVTKT